MDLIDDYMAKGLISDPTRNFITCECCGKKIHPDEINTRDIYKYGDHYAIEICDCCDNKED